MSRRIGWASAALVMAVLVSGCLGSSGSSSQQSTLSRSEFTSQAEAICAAYTKQIAALPVPTDLAGLAEQGERAVQLQQEEVDRLRSLDPPEAQAAQVEKMLAAVDDAIGDGHDLIDAARTGHRDAVTEAVTALRGHLETANELARQLDLGTCAISG